MTADMATVFVEYLFAEKHSTSDDDRLACGMHRWTLRGIAVLFTSYEQYAGRMFSLLACSRGKIEPFTTNEDLIYFPMGFLYPKYDNILTSIYASPWCKIGDKPLPRLVIPAPIIRAPMLQ